MSASAGAAERTFRRTLCVRQVASRLDEDMAADEVERGAAGARRALVEPEPELPRTNRPGTGAPRGNPPAPCRGRSAARRGRGR
jgi:hypothetical protein